VFYQLSVIFGAGSIPGSSRKPIIAQLRRCFGRLPRISYPSTLTSTALLVTYCRRGGCTVEGVGSGPSLDSHRATMQTGPYWRIEWCGARRRPLTRSDPYHSQSARLLFVVYDRETPRINRSQEWLMSNVINWPTTRYGIFWQPPGTARRESVGRGFEPRPPH
jgi:hypothetical protein